jgi:hypothetical protein
MSVPANTAGQSYTGARSGSRRHPRALARDHRDALRRRTRRIRRSVAGLAITLFALAFLVIYVQLASGHDPALVANTEKRATVSTGASHRSSSGTSTDTSEGTGESSTASEGSSESSGAGESSGSSNGTTEASGGSASAVTTSQS